MSHLHNVAQCCGSLSWQHGKKHNRVLSLPCHFLKMIIPPHLSEMRMREKKTVLYHATWQRKKKIQHSISQKPIQQWIRSTSNHEAAVITVKICLCLLCSVAIPVCDFGITVLICMVHLCRRGRLLPRVDHIDRFYSLTKKKWVCFYQNVALI